MYMLLDFGLMPPVSSATVINYMEKEMRRLPYRIQLEIKTK